MKRNTIIDVQLTADQIADLLRYCERGEAIHPRDQMLIAEALRAAVAKARTKAEVA